MTHLRHVGEATAQSCGPLAVRPPPLGRGAAAPDREKGARYPTTLAAAYRAPPLERSIAPAAARRVPPPSASGRLVHPTRNELYRLDVQQITPVRFVSEHTPKDCLGLRRRAEDSMTCSISSETTA
jgi:hypothetical protein